MARLNPLEQTFHQQFSEYGRNAKKWARKCVLLLPEIERRQIWRKKKFSSIYEYAAKLAGMNHATVDEALRVLHKLEDMPLLKKVLEEKGLQRVRPVVSIASPETESFWAKKALTMSKNALETYVHDYRLEFLPREGTQSVKLTIDLSPKVLACLEKMRGERSWDDLMIQLLDPMDSVEKPEVVHGESRYIPKKIEDYAWGKMGGLCAHPDCMRVATSLHHTQRFALERVHDPARLQPLCTAHERIAHKGLIENEEESPEKWRIRKEPDKNDPKFYVDTLVSLYRQSG